MFSSDTDGVPNESPFPDGWGDAADSFADLAASNFFAAEIEDIDASAWDADSSHIWDDGLDDAPPGDVDDAGSAGFEFPL